MADLPIAAPPVMARVMAAMHGAMFDAVNSIEGRHTPYRFPVAAPSGGSAESAAGAAHGVLVKLVPAQKTNLDNALAARSERLPTANRRTMAWHPGRWQRTPPAMAPGVLPQLGGVLPFAIKTATQFPESKRSARRSLCAECASSLD